MTSRPIVMTTTLEWIDQHDFTLVSKHKSQLETTNFTFKICVEKCPEILATTCSEPKENGFTRQFRHSRWSNGISLAVTLILAFVIFFTYKSAGKYTRWCNCMCTLMGTVGSIFLIVSCVLEKDALYIGIFGYASLGAAVVLLFHNRHHSALRLLLYEESLKFLHDVTISWLLPFSTLMPILFSVSVVYLYCLIFQKESEPDISRLLLRLYGYFNFLCAWFLYELTFLSQDFIIASAVSQWYFTLEKMELIPGTSQQKQAYLHLVKFHIGSICCIGPLRNFKKVTYDHTNSRKWCAVNKDKTDIEKFLSNFKLMGYHKNAKVILIAMKGTSEKVSKLLMEELLMNATNLIALDRFGFSFLNITIRIFVTYFAGVFCYTIQPIQPVFTFHNLNHFPIVTIDDFDLTSALFFLEIGR